MFKGMLLRSPPVPLPPKSLRALACASLSWMLWAHFAVGAFSSWSFWARRRLSRVGGMAHVFSLGLNHPTSAEAFYSLLPKSR